MVVVAAAVAATPAPAPAAVTHQMAAAGPAFMGDAIVWAQEPRDGSASVLRWVPGRRIERLYRIPAPRSRSREVGIVSLTASGDRLTFVRSDSRVVDRTSDSVDYAATMTPIGALAGGVFAPLLTGCVTGDHVSSATDGATVALVTRDERCAGGAPADRLWLIDGAGPPRMMLSIAADDRLGLTDVRLAGPYLAWSAGDRRITIVRRADGARVAGYGPADLGGRRLDGWDLDADGTIAATITGQARCHVSCLRVRPLGSAAPRTISRHVAGDAEIAGGRVAYVTDDRAGRGQLVVTDRGGRVLRRLDRTTRNRGILGVALEPDRIAWGVTIGDPAAGSHWSNRGEIRAVALP